LIVYTGKTSRNIKFEKKKMTIAIASDHAGVDYKSRLVAYLKSEGHNILDLGPYNEERVDYPDYAHALSEKVSTGQAEIGVLFCGSGNGINMSANKHQAIRSALCWNKEIAELARLHNKANVLTMPARFISFEEVKEIASTFLNTAFEGGRHEERVRKISCF
jgi:ribose 5-phosphate isomerase B